MGWSLKFNKEVKSMDIDYKIEVVNAKIESYKKILDEMPKDTFLGRLCIKAYLKREEKKLKDLLDTKNSCS